MVRGRDFNISNPYFFKEPSNAPMLNVFGLALKHFFIILGIGLEQIQ